MRFWFFFTVILVLPACNARSQQYETTQRWSAFVSAGYGNTAPRDGGTCFDYVLQPYRAENVSVPTQRPFGPSLGGSAGVIYNRLETLALGFATGYWYSPAFSSYKDQAGTLKVKGSVSSFELGFRMSVRLQTIGDFSLNLTLQPGVAYTSVSITEDLKFSTSSNPGAHSRMTGSLWGPCAQGSIGTSIPIGVFVASLDAGYKFTWTRFSLETVESSTGVKREIGPFDLGDSGPIVFVTLSKKL